MLCRETSVNNKNTCIERENNKNTCIEENEFAEN